MSILAELAHVKALFQARTIAAVIGAEPPRPEDFGINAALADRKANRPALKAQARSDAAKRGWISRRAGA
jgi:hypothetical protein